jgi:Flp pilus assembly protein TadG
MRFLQKYRHDRRGTIALMTAMLMFPLIFFAVGVPIDLARQVQLRSALQNIADDAATAGAKELADGATGPARWSRSPTPM